MKPTKALSLILTIVVVAPLAWLAAVLLVLRGFPSPTSGINISVALVAVGLVILGLAWPIYRYRTALKRQSKAASQALGSPGATVPAGATAAATSGRRPARVDPFYAVRVLVLSKAITFTSALFIGWHLGVVLMQLTAPIVVAGVWKNVVALLASGFSLAAALAVERICRLPQDGAADLPSSSEASPA